MKILSEELLTPQVGGQDGRISEEGSGPCGRQSGGFFSKEGMFHSTSPQPDSLISQQESGEGWGCDVWPPACKLTSPGEKSGHPVVS